MKNLPTNMPRPAKNTYMKTLRAKKPASGGYLMISNNDQCLDDHRMSSKAKACGQPRSRRLFPFRKRSLLFLTVDAQVEFSLKVRKRAIVTYHRCSCMKDS